MNISSEDADLVTAIQAGGPSRQRALDLLIHQKQILQEAMHFLKAQHIKSTHMDDVVQDAFIIFDRNIRMNTFRQACSLKTYFISIVKWQLLNQNKKISREILVDAHDQNIHDLSTIHLLASTEQEQVITRLLTDLGDRCKRILTLFQSSYSMKEIAEIVGFSNEQVANNEVGKCRKKLRLNIEKDPALVEFFNITN